MQSGVMEGRDKGGVGDMEIEEGELGVGSEQLEPCQTLSRASAGGRRDQNMP